MSFARIRDVFVDLQYNFIRIWASESVDTYIRVKFRALGSIRLYYDGEFRHAFALYQQLIICSSVAVQGANGWWGFRGNWIGHAANASRIERLAVEFYSGTAFVARSVFFPFVLRVLRKLINRVSGGSCGWARNSIDFSQFSCDGRRWCHIPVAIFLQCYIAT